MVYNDVIKLRKATAQAVSRWKIMIRVEILKSNLKGFKCNAKLINGFYECITPFGKILYRKNEVKILN